MKIDVMTLFPGMLAPMLSYSILGRAARAGLLDIALHDIRDYTTDKRKSTDDYTYGGGAGMLMTPKPIIDCMKAVAGDSNPFCVYMSPRGRPLSTDMARELSQKSHLLILCGHYEGIDERVLAHFDDQISIGDYVLTGGELPAMVLIDCLSRFIPGVLGHAESSQEESFCDGLLEYPQYTRPETFDGVAVPETLLGGNHAEIKRWRREQQLRLTLALRPDLLRYVDLPERELAALQRILHENL